MRLESRKTHEEGLVTRGRWRDDEHEWERRGARGVESVLERERAAGKVQAGIPWGPERWQNVDHHKVHV